MFNETHLSPDQVTSSSFKAVAKDVQARCNSNDVRVSKILCNKLRMMETLNDKLLAKKWDDALDMVNTSHDLARTANEYGDLPLHTALWVCAPKSVITTLIEVFEDAVRIPNKRLSLPLHIAINFGNPVSTIKLLLTKFPSAQDCRNLEGKTPFDYAFHEVRKCEKSENIRRFRQELISKTSTDSDRNENIIVKDDTVEANMQLKQKIDLSMKIPPSKRKIVVLK